MKRSYRIAVEAISARLDEHGIRWRVIMGGKHPAVVATAPDGTEHRIPFSGSPRSGDEEQRNNNRQKADRLLCAWGLLIDRGKPGERPVWRRRRIAEVRPPKIVADPPSRLSRDPWAALREWGRW